MYTFLLASLPPLAPETPPPLTLRQLDDAAEAALISAAERAALDSFDGVFSPADAEENLPRVYREYLGFEIFLRMRIARKRADRNGVALELPASELFDAETALRVDQAAALPPVEREKSLDALRWRKIGEIAGFHEFDFDALCVYRLKLMLLIARNRRDTARGRAAFASLLDEKAAMA